ncbi:MAG: hypothetical protein ABH842_04460 [Candidatus Micrarchaeota archaeon]
MGGPRLFREDQREVREPSLRRKRAVFGKFAAAIALGTFTFFNGININNFGVNTAMAERRRAPPEAALKRKAEEGITTFKQFMLTGDPAKKARVLEILQDRSPAFLELLRQEFLTQLRPEPTGPIIRSVGEITGTIDLDQLIVIFDKIHTAIKAGRPGIQALQSEYNETMFDNVVVPIVNLAGRGDLIGSSPETLASAQTNASLFVGLIRAREREARKEIAVDLWRRINADVTGNGGVFPAEYMKEFFAAVNTQDPKIAAILTGYATDKKTTVENLTPEQVGELFNEHLLPVMAQLQVSQTDMTTLARIHGTGLTTATSAYMLSLVPKKVITVDDLLTRVSDIEEFLREKGITLPAAGATTPEEMLAAHIKTWRDELQASPNQKKLDILNSQIPTEDELEQIEKVTAIRARRINNLIAGTGSFYEVIGARIFIPRLESYLSQVDSYALDSRIGVFAKTFMRKHNIDRDKLHALLETTRQANTAVPAAIETLDTDLRTLGAQDAAGTSTADLRAQRVTQLNILLTTQVEAITDSLAAFSGLTRGSDEWQALKKSVAVRFMRQYIAIQSDDPVADMVRMYETIAGDPKFLTFSQTFTDTLGVHLSNLTAQPAATEGERYMQSSRIATAQTAIQTFAGLPLQSKYALYQALQSKYKDLSTQFGNPEEMARVCSLIVGYSGLPAGYAALAYAKTTDTLLERYDEASIIAITKAITQYSQMFIVGDHYRLLQAYYEDLPKKLEKLFPDITAMQSDRREPTKDVRIRMPPEADYGEVMIPAAQMIIRVPKRIYETWTQKYGLTITQAPRIVDDPAASADLFRTMGVFFDESMVNVRTTIPFPWTRLPLLMNNLGFLAPDQFPDVGELIGMRIASTTEYEMHRVETDLGDAGRQSSETQQGSVEFTEEFTREGQVTTAKQRYEITAQTATDTEGVVSGEKKHVGYLELQQLRIAPEGSTPYNINTFTGDIQVIEEPPVVAQGEEAGTGTDPRVSAVGTYFSGMAPAGADTLIYFKRTQARDTVGTDGTVVPGDVALTAHLFQRFANGSFVEIDTVTLPKETAESLYWQTIERPMQRLYTGGRVQEGDVIAQLDGAFLFSGPFTGEPETEWEQFQGAGAAFQKAGWGGYVDYEETRGRRGAAAFGNFRPEDQSLWIGRISGDGFKYGDPQAGNKIYLEGQYIKVSRTEIKAFVGFSDREEDMAANDLQGVAIVNHALREPVLGYGHVGIGGGRLIRRSGDPTNQFVDDLSGGRLYGIQSDMLGGFVASGLYRKYSVQQGLAGTTPLGNLGIEDSSNPALDDAIDAQHPELTDQEVVSTPVGEQILIAAGFRRWLAAQHGLEVGALWDFTPNEGGGFVQYDWTPMGSTFTKMRLTAAVVHKKVGGDPLDSGGEHITLPIIGASTDWIANDQVRLKVDGYFPGLGEVKVFAPPVDTVFGGGYLDRVAYGAHLGFRIPLTLDRRLIMGILFSGSEDMYSDPSIQVSPTGEISTAQSGTWQLEAGIPLFYTFPLDPQRGMQLGNIYGWITGMYQEDEAIDAQAYQLELRGGAMFTDATTQVRADLLGRQYQQWLTTGSEMRTGVGTSVIISKRGFWGTWIDPYLQLNFNVDRVLQEVGPVTTEQLDISGTLELKATF